MESILSNNHITPNLEAANERIGNVFTAAEIAALNTTANPCEQAVEAFIAHIKSCNNSTYRFTAIDTERLLMRTELGKGANIHNAMKYLSRYVEGTKSGNATDLLKAAHYLLFEYQRLLNEKEVN